MSSVRVNRSRVVGPHSCRCLAGQHFHALTLARNNPPALNDVAKDHFLLLGSIGGPPKGNVHVE
jgi:hypothetical protein